MPDIAFYFRVPLEVSIDRILTGRTKLKYYEAGMDLGLSRDPEESFKLFQERILKAYDGMTEEFGFTVMDGTLPIEEQQEKMREIVDRELEGFKGLRRPVREVAVR
jgi:dTMP kinase